MKLLIFSSVLLVVLTLGDSQLDYKKYEPNWDSIDSRELPAWYDEAKVGIFLHWGVFSVPSFSSEWFWSQWALKDKSAVDFMKKNYKPDFTYQDFAPQFSAEFFNPDEWADIFKASGAKYVVLTSKHHEGFTLWPSKYSFSWNAMDVGPKRDLVGDLAKSVRNRTDIRFGLYHSWFEWFNPLYLRDKKNNFTTHDFVKFKAFPELVELVNTYEPEVIWSDGDWEAPDSYWRSTDFLAWLYNSSPVKDTVAVNDRWGINTTCHHGGYLTCTDKYNPGTLQPRKWENAMTIDLGSWGYRRTAKYEDYISIEDLLSNLAGTVSCGGNLLINVGPTPDGRIAPIFEERLRQLGAWLQINGEAIYGSVPWTHQNDTLAKGVWYTKRVSDSDSAVYAIILNWPQSSVIKLGAIKPVAGTVVTMLGVDRPLAWKFNDQGTLLVPLPYLTPDIPASKWAWVLKFTAPEDRGYPRKRIIP